MRLPRGRRPYTAALKDWGEEASEMGHCDLANSRLTLLALASAAMVRHSTREDIIETN